jgi:hypothetical protein
MIPLLRLTGRVGPEHLEHTELLHPLSLEFRSPSIENKYLDDDAQVCDFDQGVLTRQKNFWYRTWFIMGSLLAWIIYVVFDINTEYGKWKILTRCLGAGLIVLLYIIGIIAKSKLSLRRRPMILFSLGAIILGTSFEIVYSLEVAELQVSAYLFIAAMYPL